MSGCVQGTTCFEILKIIPTAAIALIVAAITLQQWRVAKAKLKLDLFDRRYKIFHQTWEILSEAATKGTREKNYGLSTPFNNYIPEAKFLFGKEVEAYLHKAVKNWADLHLYETEERQSTYAEKKSVVSGWFHDQADRGVKELFDPYLDFSKWK
jgi:hypothetical protein